MSRIPACFERLRTARRKVLIPYLTAGDPSPDLTVPLMHTLVQAGANILELGVPFSDPMADGPVIQAACERALAHRVNLKRVLNMVQEFRLTDTETPVVLMGYLNPIEAMGYAAFTSAAREASVDGVLTIDLPPEEGRGLIDVLKEAAIDPIFLLAPTTTLKRARYISAMASGFIYYVSLRGVTGSTALNLTQVSDRLRQLRAVTTLPMGVGFGIRDGATAARVAQIADAVVVGTALVSRIAAVMNEPAKIPAVAGALVAEMREAMDA